MIGTPSLRTGTLFENPDCSAPIGWNSDTSVEAMKKGGLQSSEEPLMVCVFCLDMVLLVRNWGLRCWQRMTRACTF